jgi:hypothetical protein
VSKRVSFGPFLKRESFWPFLKPEDDPFCKSSARMALGPGDPPDFAIAASTFISWGFDSSPLAESNMEVNAKTARLRFILT